MTTDGHAKYACDACRSRKMACTREMPECSRCRAQEIACVYSRSGVLRRSRKRKASLRTTEELFTTSSRSSPYQSPTSPARPAQATVTERLQRLVGREHISLQDLGRLMSEYHTVWQDPSIFDELAKNAQTHYYVFEKEQQQVWIDEMCTAVRQSQFASSSVPPNVLDSLIASKPEQIRERAWLVIFYSIALSNLNGTTSSPHSARLRSNLWLAFNDVRFLLEPSFLNIQALITMTLHAEKYLAPYACWALISKACTMLIALGIGTHAHIDPTTKKQRDALFWRLNALDKALSLILSRSPIFQRDLMNAMPLPTLEELLSTRPRSDGMPLLFEAHFDQQMYLLSRVQAEVWHCLPGQETQNVDKVRKDLQSWHTEAAKILEASALVEKPLLSVRGQTSVDLRLQILLFNYYYLDVLLMVASKDLRSQCIVPAQKLLNLLPHLGELLSDNRKETHSCMLWEWLHYPMMAFGTLWGQVISKGGASHEQSETILETLNNVPKFLERLESRHVIIGGKLKGITESIIHHVGAIYHASSPTQQRVAASDDTADPAQMQMHTYHSQTVEPFDMPSTSTDSTFNAPLEGLMPLPDDFLLDPTFDWFAWGDQTIL
ncbi:hypothetical protein P171DRAFT_518818 [Karstenula rhodostoma CBS 690.94]|uniref:Zn(2)-C6 fungal-type domain-containing protein n=1 Tax=Karstenula rhodostoma CBS 690.94 TaxID=1392251 RepID=A0A9P4PPI9_9PLEO|nr:hypothetical protein P171DRAFT_518818 [Karstenula rhodostoma CBS 690.94]